MRYSLFVCSIMLISCNSKNKYPALPDFDDALVQKIRKLSVSIPGDLPTQISYQKYASSIRRWEDLIEDGGKDAAVMARTAFKIQYADGFIMVDAGMDRQVHHFFEKEGPQPYDDAAAAKVSKAVQDARMIIITHEHGDHVANAIRMADDNIPLKTILTKEQAQTLINEPQMPEIKLTEERSKSFVLVEFESILPVAPGVVLIKAPGHTRGEVMLYTKLQNGREYIFAGDVSWTYKGIEENKQKPSSERKRIGEDKESVAKELSWLHDRLLKDKMTILVSHDDIMLPQFAAAGIIQNGF